MIPVYAVESVETIETPGDCLRACVASILELKLSDVPHFAKRRSVDEDWNEDWEKDLVDFFYQHGYRAYWGKKWKWDYTGNYSIGYGQQDDTIDTTHAVVCWNGTIIHDPAGYISLKSVPYYLNLENL